VKFEFQTASMTRNNRGDKLRRLAIGKKSISRSQQTPYLFLIAPTAKRAAHKSKCKLLDFLRQGFGALGPPTFRIFHRLSPPTFVRDLYTANDLFNSVTFDPVSAPNVSGFNLIQKYLVTINTQFIAFDDIHCTLFSN